MNIYAIGDLHLGGAQGQLASYDSRFKNDYIGKLFSQWQAKVTDKDIVLIPGDVIDHDLNSLFFGVEAANFVQLPGTIIISVGNTDIWDRGISRHGYSQIDYLWQQYSRVKSRIHPNTGILSAICDNVKSPYGVIIGSQGIDGDFREDFIFNTRAKKAGDSCRANYRYSHRSAWEELERKIKTARPSTGLKIGMVHHPPFSPQCESNSVTQAFANAGFSTVVFGHLHRKSTIDEYGFEPGKPVVVDGVKYYLTSSNFLDFDPLLVHEDDSLEIPFDAWKAQNVSYFPESTSRKARTIKRSASSNQPSPASPRQAEMDIGVSSIPNAEFSQFDPSGIVAADGKDDLDNLIIPFPNESANSNGNSTKGADTSSPSKIIAPTKSSNVLIVDGKEIPWGFVE